MRFSLQRAILISISIITVVIAEEENGNKPKSGPFRNKLQKMTPRCDQPSQPYERDMPSITPKFELYNTSTKINLLRAKFTIVKMVANMAMKIMVYKIENGEPNLKYNIDQISCKSLILKAFVSIAGAPYGLNTCRYTKGVIVLNSIDINSMGHVWMKKMEYGRLLWRVEAFSRNETVVCMEFEVIAEPV